MNSDDEELEALRRKKLEELQLRKQQMAVEDQERERVDSQIQAILRQILTPEARERLGNLKVARPEHAAAVEQQLVVLAQSGRLSERVTDEMMKQILTRIVPKKKEIKIERR